jgi:Holliday junction DNA helicase RuvA
VIRSVRGRLVALESDGVVVEVGGVGLQVRVSATTARALPRAGEEVRLQTHLVVREDALDLYGFADRAERELFEAFIGVSGVGPRIALAICGLDAPDALRLALARGDSAVIQRASGVGKRTAERVVLELSDRMALSQNGASTGAAVALGGADAFIAARDGLLALGFRPDEVEAALADAPAGESDPEALLRHALAKLRRK